VTGLLQERLPIRRLGMFYWLNQFVRHQGYFEGKYQTAPDMNTRCDKSAYECGTVSMFNQYALGADLVGVRQSAREISPTSLGVFANNGLKLALTKIMESGCNQRGRGFHQELLRKTTPSGKKKTFPAVFLYLLLCPRPLLHMSKE